MRELVRKFDDEQRIVFSEVYAPNLPDSQGDFMTAVEIRKMAHRFLISGGVGQIDTMHDNQVNGSYVVESFIARPNDPDGFLADAWVLGVHIPDDDLWERTKKGEINGFSMEALVTTENVEIEVTFPEEVRGLTVPDLSGHRHRFVAKFDKDGQTFLGGHTDEVDGHSHEIRRMTHTSETVGHKHRVFLLEGFEIVE